MDRFLIIDGHAYAYRAFHAIRGLRSPAGEPTNAIYGFIKMVVKLQSKVKPTHQIVVWDGGLSEERLAQLPEYKAQRPDMPEDLKPQLDGMTAYLKAAGVGTFCGEGVEADDYIATLSRRAVAGGMSVVIASADKDFMQLVGSQVGLLNPNDKTEMIWTDEQVLQKSGVKPGQVVEWLSLMGDAVDNIPGVPGVGPKTAADLLNQFGSIDGIYARLNEVKSEKIRKALSESEKLVRRNLDVIRLHDNLACEFAPDDLAVKPSDDGRLRGLYQHWGFNGLLAALPGLKCEQQAVLI